MNIIPVEKVEKYKSSLIQFYETNNNIEITEFIKNECCIKI